jgi:uncharacterized RDD family membrane protein YckC
MTHPQLARPFKRWAAAFLDGVLVMPLGLIPLLGILVALVYLFTKDTLPFLNGQSIGKKAMGLRVVRESTGQPITGDYAAGVVRQLSLMIPIFGIIDALCVFSESHKRQRFGDRWAKTIVIQESA